jgi:acetolactate synthase-1/2/3 large subunit
MTTTIARDIATTLAESGIRDFFMLTGGDQPLWIALRDQGIRMLVARSEASAVYMADGFARARSGPAIVYGQAGPGAANVAAALADPYWAQSPVVALTGSNATGAMHVNEYQALDQFAMFRPVTKWNGNVAHPAQAAMLTRHAIQSAVTGTPGPTHLDVPKDLFGQPSPGRPAAIGNPWPTQPPMPAQSVDIDTALAALRKAERPLILVGDGARAAGAWDELAAFATAAGLPVVATMGGKPAIASAHPNFIGIIGRYSSVAANALASEADCVLALGTRLGGLATNGWRIPAATATVIQIDRDPAAFVTPYCAAHTVTADLRLALAALGAAHDGKALGRDAAWLAHCQSIAARWRDELIAQTRAAHDATPLSPLTVLAELVPYASETTLVADTGYMAAWTGVLFPVHRPDAYFRATGSLGWALPASLGVQLARQEKVVCVTGDGGAGYHLADIETAVRYRLPVVILVLNNDCLAFEYHEQKYRWNGDVIAQANDFTRVDYARVAEGLGASARRVETRAALAEALAAAMQASGPYVIDVAIDREAFPPVTNFDAHMQRAL